MNILVVGLGSMGKRRIRLIKLIEPEALIVGVDSREDRRIDAETSFGIRTFDSLEKTFEMQTFDCGFVCTTPKSHRSIIYQFVKKKINVFTELNLLDDGYDELIMQSEVKVFLSSTFLYRRDIQWIIRRIKEENDNGRCVNYLYHTGQYLPDWHPWEDYKDFFVSDKRTNGCREIMAIELPWLINCFGDVKRIWVIKSDISQLKLDFSDSFLITIEHENGNKGVLAVDVVARKAIRRIDIYNDMTQVYWNGTPDSLEELDVKEHTIKHISTYETVTRDKRYSENIIENAYVDEIVTFFKYIRNEDCRILHDIKRDKRILNLIDRIEDVKV